MLRPVFAFLLFLFSLLSVVKAPLFILWLCAILVTEFVLAWLAASLVLLLISVQKARFRTFSVFFSCSAALLFAVPLIVGCHLGAGIEGQMDHAFSPARRPGWNLTYHTNLLAMLGLKKEKAVSFEKFDFKSEDSSSLSLDYYRSRGKSAAPLVLVIHGGSWSGGDSQQLPELNWVLANDGYAVATMNYRLAPRFKSPDPLQDVHSALQYLKKNARTLGLDSSQVVILGRSAGAQIALLAAYTFKDPAIKGVIDFYGPADMVWGYAHPSNPLVLNSCKVMEDYLGGTYRQVPGNYLKSSPLEFVDSNSVPTLILHGMNDVLVAWEHSRRLEAKLAQARVPHYLLSLPWATHGFDYTLNGPGGQLSTYSVRRFLAGVTGRSGN